jgi:glycosidase
VPYKLAAASDEALNDPRRARKMCAVNGRASMWWLAQETEDLAEEWQDIMKRGWRTTGWLLVVLLALCAPQTSCFDVPADELPAKTSEVEDWRDEVIYQVLIDRFANGDPNNDYNLNLAAPTGWHGGDWQGTIDKLDYLKGLGVTTLWISPAVKNVEEDAGVAGYHGYWTQHFQATNPHFGDMVKLRQLVEEAHRRDMKVILDIVTNHIGQLFYYDINLNGAPDINIQGSGYCYRGGPPDTSGNPCDGQTSPFVRVTEWDPDYDPRGVQAYTSLGESGAAPIRWVYMPEVNRVPPLPVEFQNPDWYNKRGRVVTPWGWNMKEQVERGDFPGGLKDIDTTRPDVREKMVEVFAWWVEQTNLDGFRIDTVKHIEHDFWRYFTKGIRERTRAMGKKNFLMFGEVFDGDDALLGSYTQPGELDSVFYFSHKFQVFDDVFKYRRAGTRKIEDLYNQRQVNFGSRGQDGGIVDSNGQPIPPTRALVNFMDNHDVPRYLYEHNDLDSLKNALFYLLTMDGIPCIYYGTEQGFNGGNDPANREDMWRRPTTPGFQTFKADDTFVPYDTAHPLYRHISRLASLRRQLAPLRRGTFEVKWSSERLENEQDAGIIAFERVYDGERVLVVLNTHPTKASETSFDQMGGTSMKVGFAPGATLMNVWEDEDSFDTVTVNGAGEVKVVVPPRGGKIFVQR